MEFHSLSNPAKHANRSLQGYKTFIFPWKHTTRNSTRTLKCSYGEIPCKNKAALATIYKNEV